MRGSIAGQSSDYNINRYRQQKRRRQWTRRLLIFVLLIIVGLGAYMVVEEIMENQQQRNVVSSASFPISFRGEDVNQLLATTDDLVIVGGSKLFFYAPSASKEGDFVHSMANPISYVYGDKVLTYDQNSTSWRVDQDGESVKSASADNAILLGRLGPKNTTALVTYSDRYNNSLIIYDSNYDQIYKYNESSRYMVGFEFVSNTTGVVLMQTLGGTSVDSVIIGLDFTTSEDTEYFSTTLSDTIVYQMMVQDNGNILLTTDSGIVTLDADGNVVNTVELQEEVSMISQEGDYLVVALENFTDSSQTDLITVSSAGEILSRTTIDGSAWDLYCDGEGILFLTRGYVWELDYDFKTVNSYENTQSYSEVLRLNNAIFCMSSEYLYIVE